MANVFYVRVEGIHRCSGASLATVASIVTIVNEGPDVRHGALNLGPEPPQGSLAA